MSNTIVLKVAMMCGGCSGAVERVLSKMEGASRRSDRAPSRPLDASCARGRLIRSDPPRLPRRPAPSQAWTRLGDAGGGHREDREDGQGGRALGGLSDVPGVAHPSIARDGVPLPPPSNHLPEPRRLLRLRRPLVVLVRHLPPVARVHGDERPAVPPVPQPPQSPPDRRLHLRLLRPRVLDDEHRVLREQRARVELEQKLRVRHLVVRRAERHEVERAARGFRASLVRRQKRLRVVPYKATAGWSS
eukprot:30108-Pelagococcus_subviridis.AAC.8